MKLRSCPKYGWIQEKMFFGKGPLGTIFYQTKGGDSGLGQENIPEFIPEYSGLFWFIPDISGLFQKNIFNPTTQFI
jgi:hypothetical protein